MSLDEGDEDVSGNLAIDGQNGRFRLSATDTHGIRVILALDVGKAVAVKIKSLGGYCANSRSKDAARGSRPRYKEQEATRGSWPYY